VKRKAKCMVFVFLLAILATAIAAQAETLAWNAVTTYTDGTSVGTAAVNYQAYWTTNSNMTGLTALGTSGTATSRTFNVDTEVMPRGSIIYFTAKATVNGTDSALATPLSWTVPTKAPSAPASLRLI
jgi:3D (Asp-Asp-Asp) domain-containing protein